MKTLNLENCARLTKGEVALKFDKENDSVEEVTFILKHCFPMDMTRVIGYNKYYYKYSNNDWTNNDWSCGTTTTLPEIPLSNFFQPAQTKYGVSGVFLSDQEYNELIEFKNKYQEILKVIER